MCIGGDLEGVPFHCSAQYIEGDCFDRVLSCVLRRIKSHFSLHLQVLLEWHGGGGIGETQRKWVHLTNCSSVFT